MRRLAAFTIVALVACAPLTSHLRLQGLTSR